MKQFAKIFKALSDVSRLRILKMLEVKPLCVCEMTSILKLATATVSKHLSILREAELVSSKKEGKWVIYSLELEKTVLYAPEFLALFLQLTDNVSEVSADRKALETVDRNFICGN